MLFVALGLPAAVPVAGQDQERPVRVWAGVGLGGAGSVSTAGGLGFLAQLAFQKRPHHAVLRGLIVADLAGFPDSGGGDVLGEIGLTYGRVSTARFGHASISTGLSVVSFDTCPSQYPDQDVCYSFGIPIVAEAAISAKVIGLGLQLFGNINHKSSYAGAAVFLQLGWMP